jgi:hypothetical protein
MTNTKTKFTQTKEEFNEKYMRECAPLYKGREGLSMMAVLSDLQVEMERAGIGTYWNDVVYDVKSVIRNQNPITE